MLFNSLDINGSMVFMSQVCNVFISRVDRHLIITLFAGWTDMETISLETGEIATLPPVCRGTTTTESAKFKYLLFILDKPYWLSERVTFQLNRYLLAFYKCACAGESVTLCNQICFIYLSDI